MVGVVVAVSVEPCFAPAVRKRSWKGNADSMRSRHVIVTRTREDAMSLDVMSLEPYRRRGRVILKARTAVLGAARGIEQNRIGVIIVQDEVRIVGSVTDRDLAVRGLGRALDPNTKTLAEVMRAPPITLSPTNK